MPNLKGVKTDKITIRLPEATIAELDELAEQSGLYRASFFGVALVSGARNMAQHLSQSGAGSSGHGSSVGATEPLRKESVQQPTERDKPAAADSRVERIRSMASMVASISSRMAEGSSGIFPSDTAISAASDQDQRALDAEQQLRLLKWQYDHLMVGIKQLQKQFDEVVKERANAGC